MIDLLQRDIGATLEELIAVTGWLPHTTRAALTGLRKRGYAVSIGRFDKKRRSTYRIPLDRIPARCTDAVSERVDRPHVSTETERLGIRERVGWRDGQAAKVR